MQTFRQDWHYQGVREQDEPVIQQKEKESIYIWKFMHKRRNRIPLQGVTNIKNTIIKNSQNPQMTSKQIPLTPTDQFHTISTFPKQTTRHSIQPQNKIPCQRRNQMGLQQKGLFNGLDEHIKQKFRNKPNIMRIVRAWKFNEKGYITKEELRDNFVKKMKLNVSQEHINLLFYTYSGGTEKLGVQQFINLIYKKPQSAYFMKKLPATGQTEEQKINSLVQSLEYNIKKFTLKELTDMNDDDYNELIKHSKKVFRKYTSVDEVSKNRDQLNDMEKQCIEKMGEIENFSGQKITPELIENSVYEYTRRNPRNKKFKLDGCSHTEETKKFALTETGFFSKKNFFNLHLTPDKLSNTREWKKYKTIELFGSPSTPSLLSSKKTRFGATIYPKTLILGDEVCANRKTALDCLNEDAHLVKNRKENRLAKIRAYKQKQNQNILAIDAKNQQTEQCNLYRKRNQKAAYQYSTSLQNKWL